MSKGLQQQNTGPAYSICTLMMAFSLMIISRPYCWYIFARNILSSETTPTKRVMTVDGIRKNQMVFIKTICILEEKNMKNDVGVRQPWCAPWLPAAANRRTTAPARTPAQTQSGGAETGEKMPGTTRRPKGAEGGKAQGAARLNHMVACNERRQ